MYTLPSVSVSAQKGIEALIKISAYVYYSEVCTYYVTDVYDIV